MQGNAVWPKVSIVTPSYNQAQYIEQTIQSVLAQNYPNLEYIVIDGGSTDGSVDIIRKYERWLTYWVSEKDHGQTDAINKGWKVSTGKIVAWLNSDDIYEANALLNIIELFNSSDDIGIVAGVCRQIDNHGNYVGNYFPTFDPGSQLVANGLAQPSTFYRKEAVEKADYLNNDLHFVMDQDLWMRIWLAGYKVETTDYILASARMWEDTKTSRDYLAVGIEHISFLDRIYDRSDLSVHILQMRPAAYSIINLRLALFNYLIHELELAKDYVVRASYHTLDPKLLSPYLFVLGELLVDHGIKNAPSSAQEFVSFIAEQGFLPLKINRERFQKELLGQTFAVQAWRSQGINNPQRAMRYAMMAMRKSSYCRKNKGLWKLILYPRYPK